MSADVPPPPAAPVGGAPPRPPRKLATRSVVRFLAACNVVGFALIFGFAGAVNFWMRWVIRETEAPAGSWFLRFVETPAWIWIALFLAGSAVVAVVDRTVRNPTAAVLVQTAIGITQIAGVVVYGLALLSGLLPVLLPVLLPR